MGRITANFGMSVPITTPVKVLSRNPNRLYYSIKNEDAANFIALSSSRTVTAGTYGPNEGQHLAAGQPISDDTDQAAVYAVADTAAVNITVQEVSEREPPNPRRPALRPKPAREEVRPGLATRVV